MCYLAAGTKRPLLCQGPPRESPKGIAVAHISTAAAAPCLPAAGGRICWFGCWGSLRSLPETKGTVKQEQACVCRQPGKLGRGPQQERPPGAVSGHAGNRAALVGATGQACTSNLEELSWALFLPRD